MRKPAGGNLDIFLTQHIMLTILCQHNMLCFLLTFNFVNVTLLISGVWLDYVNHIAAGKDITLDVSENGNWRGLNVSGYQKRRRCSGFYFDENQ